MFDILPEVIEFYLRSIYSMTNLTSVIDLENETDEYLKKSLKENKTKDDYKLVVSNFRKKYAEMLE